MITAVLMEGTDFDNAESIGTFEAPVLPRIGEIITLPIEQRFRVTGVNYHQVQLASKVEIFLYVEELPTGGGYSFSDWLK